MKFLTMLVLLSSVSACKPFGSDSSSSSKQATAAAYLSCTAIPTGAITDHSGCPGSAGTWNNYEAKIDSNGDVISIDLYCGGGDTEHPMTQTEYDGYAGMGESSNADYKKADDCVSGTRTNDLSGDITVNIWHKI